MSEERAGLPIRVFPDAASWAAWMAAEPADSRGVWCRIAKAGAGETTVTKAQAIDVALAHGWMDGQLNPYDARLFLIRFTPRGPRSKWPEKNRTRALEVVSAGRMTAAGLAAIEVSKADGRWDAAYAPQSTATVPDDLAAALADVPGAAAFFADLDAANRYAILYRLHTAPAATRGTKLTGSWRCARAAS